MHGGSALRDLLPGFRDDREADAAGDRLFDLLPEVLADLRKRRRRDDARLRGLIDQLADFLEHARLRDDRVDELGFALRPEDFVEQVELAERILQVLDDAPLHLARSLGLEDRRTAAGGDREAFLAQALKDLVCGRPRLARFALVLVLLLFWSVLPPTVGQGSTGHLVVSTDYELFGTSDLRGGGHVTWTLTGDKATDLRMKILHMFDEYATIPRGFTFAFAPPGTVKHNSRLDAIEGVRYTDLLENLLEASGRGTSA